MFVNKLKQRRAQAAKVPNDDVLQQHWKAGGCQLVVCADGCRRGCAVLADARALKGGARIRLHIVLLYLLSRWCSATGQPDPRLHSVGGKRLLDAALQGGFDSCQVAACGCSMAARKSSRRPPRCNIAAVLVARNALFEAWMTACRRS